MWPVDMSRHVCGQCSYCAFSLAFSSTDIHCNLRPKANEIHSSTSDFLFRLYLFVVKS